MKADKQIFFKSATVQLLSKIDEMGIHNANAAKELVVAMRKGFMNDGVRRQVFGNKLADDMSPYAANGFCAASCILFLLVVGDAFELNYIDDMWTFGPHYFLKQKSSGRVLDLTFDQFAQEGISAIPYDMGRPVKPTKYSMDMALRFAKAIDINVPLTKRLTNAKTRTIR
ncbi:MAG: hypothetical protein K5912_01340 [Alphaproteobacteria bacterium]|nr:hypothetical protein [Alphaproteobacteria bacterium]